MNCCKWIKIFFCEIIVILLAIFFLVIYVDPFFHFHKPNPSLNYKLDGKYERYFNNGILRFFDYDAIITGTSMTENFKASDAEKIFGGSFVKVPYAGASIKEVSDRLDEAFIYKKEIRYVIRSLDIDRIINIENKFVMNEGIDLKYLYNDNLYDDVFYIYNIDTLKFSLRSLYNTLKYGSGITSFDDYVYWSDSLTYGYNEIVKKKKIYAELSQSEKILTEDEKKSINEHVEKYLVRIAREHPETIFYYFIPPYSILYWQDLKERGLLAAMLEAEEIVISNLVKEPNIRIYSFNLNEELITDFDNYGDIQHYGGWVNKLILEWMKEDVGRLTKDNYKQYLENEKKMFMYNNG